MTDFLERPWLGWALTIAIGLPVLTLVMTEVIRGLQRRGSPYARPARLIRNTVLPAVAVWILLEKVAGASPGTLLARIAATVIWLAFILLALSLLSAAIFGGQEGTQGSWRSRLPRIFVDLGKLIVIVVGLAVVTSSVWGADVGAVFAALGVTSIVLGLALQNSVGNIISGLLLLFEQPFTIHDWLTVGDVTGRVTQVNWRATHLSLGTAVQVIPNGSLADQAFTNHSRPQGPHAETVELRFALGDPPNEVREMLNAVAASIPQLVAATEPSTVVSGCGDDGLTYATTLQLNGFALAAAARDTFLTRVWYASSRAGLSLMGIDRPEFTLEQRKAGIGRIAARLYLTEEGVDALAEKVTMRRYGAGEVIERVGAIPASFGIIGDGTARLYTEDGAPSSLLEPGEFVGVSSLTHNPANLEITALGDVELILIDDATVHELIDAEPRLARDLDEVKDQREKGAVEAVTAGAIAAPG